MAIIALAAAIAVSCSKSELTPPKPGEETMTLNKSSVSLEYLKRDTLKVTTPGVDQSKVEWFLYPEDTKVAVLVEGNIIVARKKGTCQVIGRSDDGKVASCTVNVTTEEYVRITELIIEVNGQQMSSKDTLRSKQYETVDIRVVGYKPANATNPVVRKTELWNDNRYYMNSIQGNSGNVFRDDITLRYKVWTDTKFYDNTTLNLFKGNIDKGDVRIKFDTPKYDSYTINPDGSSRQDPDYNNYYFKFRFEAYPEDIVLTEDEQKFKKELEEYDWCKIEVNPGTSKSNTWRAIDGYKSVDYDYIASKHKMCINFVYETKP